MSLKAKKISIVTHRQADVDAVSSAVALQRFLITYLKLGREKIKIFFPESISKDGEKLLREFANDLFFEYQISKEMVKEGLLIILDTSSLLQLPNLDDNFFAKKEDVLLIDHHYYNSLRAIVSNYYIDLKTTSVSETIASIYDEKYIDPSTACLLMAGILYDSSKFSRASPNTFQIASILTEKCPYELISSVALESSNEDESLKLAKLKACQRLQIVRIRDKIISITHVSSFESSVATQFLRIGADVSIVLSPKGKFVRMIIRSKGENGINLATKIANAISKHYSADIGGHREAIVMELKREIKKREIPKLVKEIKRIIEEV